MSNLAHNEVTQEAEKRGVRKTQYVDHSAAVGFVPLGT